MLKYFLIFFVIFTGLAILPAYAITEFTPFQNISNTPNDSINPFVVTDGKNIFITWSEFAPDNKSGGIFFSKSVGGGATFSSPQNISNKPGSSIAPTMVIDNTTIFITWTYRYQEDHYSEIFFSKSTDGGVTFSIPQKISGPTFSYGSRLVTDGMNIFVTWGDITYSDNRYENMEIFFSKSIDGGATFSIPQNISNTEEFSQNSSIATDGKNIFITWQDQPNNNSDIFVSKSTDGGTTFSTPLNISNSPDDSVGAKIITDGTNIFVTWFEFSKGIGEIFFSKSTDGGATFSTPMNLSKNKENSIVPFMVTDGKDIFITWTDATTTGSWIVFSKSTDGGATFSVPQKISNDKGFSDAQSVTTDGTTVFTAWNYRQLQTSQYDILFSKSVSPETSTENTSEKISNDDIVSKKEQPDTVQEPESDNHVDLSSTQSIAWLNENGANYTVNGWGVLRLDNSNLNINKQLIDIPIVHVWSNTDPKGILVDVIETGPDTGVFYADIALVDVLSSHLSLQVSSGDTVTVSFDDKLTDTVKITSKYLSPRKQIESGIQPDEITCKAGLELVIKTDHKHSPLCLTPDTKSKMIQRGLAMSIQTAN